MAQPRTRICSTFRGGDQHPRLVLADDAKLQAGLAEEGSALGEDYNMQRKYDDRFSTSQSWLLSARYRLPFGRVSLLDHLSNQNEAL